jgi:hypothetical protein
MLEKIRFPIRILFIISSLAYLILAMHLPVSIYTNEGHDDALYWENAQQIIQGRWLGTYSNMTLAKGAGFPLFLAINAVLGIPVTLLIALFYLFACGLLAKTLLALNINKYFVLSIFMIILFHPALFLIRIVRDDIYPALSLVIISGVIRLVFAPQQFDNKLRSVIPYSLAFSLFWITREEGIWIIPGIIFLLIFKVLQLKKQNLPIKAIFCRFSFFTAIAIVFVSLVALVNYYNYGKFEVVDFKGEAYSHALKSLNSVDVGPELPYLPVSFAKRQVIYKISPSFEQLKDYFEEKGKGWAIHGCKFADWTCGDYAGGWFVWALRDGVASKGFYDTPVHAAEFYANITTEIHVACDEGLIKCKTNPFPLMPNISTNQMKELPEKIVSAFKLAMVQEPVAVTGGASMEPLNKLQNVRLFLGNPLTTPAESEVNTSLNGWFYSSNSNWLSLNCLVNGREVNKVVERMASPDIALHFKDHNANFQRFSISVQDSEICSVVVVTAPVNKYPVKLLKLGQTQIDSNGQSESLFIDSISNAAVNPAVEIALKIKTALATIYQKIIPYFVIVGACVYFIYLTLIVLKRKPITDIFIVSTMLWCLLLSRIIILVLVDISSFPAINFIYMSAAFPILCLAAFLSIQLLFV